MFLSVSALFDNRQIRIVLRCVKTHVAVQQRNLERFSTPRARAEKGVFRRRAAC
jgi:hypothetical protein